MGTATGQSPAEAVITMLCPAVATGSDDETVIGVAPFTGVVSAAAYIADTAITGADTNTRKIELFNRGQAGAGTTLIASKQFDNAVNATRFDETALTLSATAANLDVVAGDVLTLKSTHVGTGLADPGGTLKVTITRD